MSVQKVFAVFDSKAKAYLQPFFAVNSAVAIRMFERASNEAEHDFHRFASDYALHEIGTWDEDSGVIESLDANLNLGVASQFVKGDVNGPR